MNENPILEQLKREALTQSEFMEINHMTVQFMNTDREYIRNCNRNFREGRALT